MGSSNTKSPRLSMNEELVMHGTRRNQRNFWTKTIRSGERKTAGSESTMSSRRDFIKNLLLTGAAASFAPAIISGTSPSLVEGLSSFYAQADGPWQLIMPRILNRIKKPTFPNRVFNIKRFGAKPDGITDCTSAFRSAIAECNRRGGGRVVVPPGSFLTGAIHLKSNVNLEVQEGATIKFSQNPKDYLPVVFSRWEGVE